jgi:glycosyltransferase involved in cell wall biosynthesis
MKSQKSKVILYSDCIFFGGSENLIVNILGSRSLNEEFDFLFVFAQHKSYQFMGKLDNNVKVIPAPIQSIENIVYDYKLESYTKYFIIKAALFILQKVIFNIYNFIFLLGLWMTEKPEILHINNGGYPGAKSCRIAALTAKVAGIQKIIFTVNNMAMPPKNILDEIYDVILYACVNIFVTASHAAKVHLINTRHIPVHKVINIPNTLLNDYKHIHIEPLLRKEYGLSDDTIVIGSAGLLAHRKGFHILLGAISQLREKCVNDNIRFFILGDGEERRNLEDYITNNRMEKIVFMPGHKDQLLNYIVDFDIFILPSIYQEDFPYVNLEAMFLGKPIISTLVAGIVEQIESQVNGILVEPGNVKEMANAIELLARDKEFRENMGRKSRHKYQTEFNYDKAINRYQDLYSGQYEYTL